MTSKFGKINPETRFSFLANLVPSPRKTGSILADSEAEGRIIMFKKLISAMETDQSNIQQFYNCFEKRQREIVKQSLAESELVQHTPLQMWSDDFLAQWIVSVSDADMELLVLALEQDEDALIYIRTFGTGLNDALSYSREGEPKNVAREVLNYYHAQRGRPLAEIKMKGMISAEKNSGPYTDEDEWLSEAVLRQGEIVGSEWDSDVDSQQVRVRVRRVVLRRLNHLPRIWRKQSERKQEAMKGAREKAKAALAVKKQKRMVKASTLV